MLKRHLQERYIELNDCSVFYSCICKQCFYDNSHDRMISFSKLFDIH